MAADCRLVQVYGEGNMFLLPVRTIAAVIAVQDIRRAEIPNTSHPSDVAPRREKPSPPTLLPSI